MNTSKKARRFPAVLMSLVMTLSLFSEITFTPIMVYAATSTVTWDSSVIANIDISSNETTSFDDSDITVSLSEMSDGYFQNSQILNYNGELQFAAEKKIASISINGIVDTISDSNWNGDENGITWSNDPDNIVTLSGETNIYEISSIVFTIVESDSDPVASTYTVTIDDTISNGTVLADKTENIEEGETVTLTVEPAENYRLRNLDISAGIENIPVDYTQDSTDETKYTFDMPNADVIVSATFIGSSTYTITKSEVVNGQLTVKVNDEEVDEARAGDTVFLDVKADTGYNINNVVIRYTKTIREFSDIVDLMGDAEFTNGNGMMKVVSENGGFIIKNYSDGWVNGSSLINPSNFAESEEYEGDYSATKTIDQNTTQTWSFMIAKGRLIQIQVDDIVFTGTGQKTLYRNVEDYDSENSTFTMPAEDITVSVVIEAIPYTVTWLNWDGTLLEKDENLAYGTIPIYDGNEPKKQGDAQYSFKFKGWDKAVTTVSCDEIYTATFNRNINKYTILWKDWNGSTLEKDEDVEYGTMPTYNGAEPTMKGDAQYTLTFAGWDKEITTVSEDTIYTATYISSINKYDVVWKNWDGTVLETDEDVEYGETPSYNGITPKKQGNAQFTYEFSGWDKEVTAVSGDTTYTATFSSSINKYTILWKDWNGSTLEKDEDVEYGTMPTYDGAEPTMKGDAHYTHTFNGWDKEVTTVSEDTIYTATYITSVNKYDVVWKNWDGTVLETDKDVEYGITPTYDGNDPVRQSNAQYTYTYSGWDKEVTPVSGDTTYTATFSSSINKYTILWKDWNGSTLEKDEDVEYGTIPTYDGSEPTMKGDAHYTLTFSGWDKEITAVTDDTIYTATYTSSVNKYTVVWKNWDGTVLETDEDVEYGTIPTYDGSEPVKQGNAQYTYEFSGWDKEVTAVSGDTTYTATFSSSINKYTILWKDWNGSTLEKDEDVEYGTIPTYDGSEPTMKGDAHYTLTFSGWDKEITAVTDDTIYTATYTSSVNKYTVVWKNWDGTVLETDEDVEYGTIPTYDGVEPTRKSDDQYTYKFSGWDKEVAAVSGDETYTATFSSIKNEPIEPEKPVVTDDVDSAEAIKDPSLFLYAVASENSKNKTASITLKWSKIKVAQSYEVYEAKCGDGSSLAKIATLDSKKKTLKIKNLEWNNCYKFVVKAIGADGKVLNESLGVHVAIGKDNETNVKAIKAKSLKLTVGTQTKIPVKVILKNKNKKLIWEGHVKHELRYFSANPNRVTVDEDGNVSAVAAGKTKLYIIAMNGVKKAISVKVK